MTSDPLHAIAALVARMDALGAELDAEGDPGRYFHATYTRTTRAVADALDDGRFEDPAWVERLGRRLRRPLPRRPARPSAAGARVAAVAARVRGDPGPARVGHVLLGINAHINSTCRRRCSR